MKFKKLIVRNFKKFKNFEIDFVDGLNVIIGPNEAGKSTITNALMEVLFVDPATKSKSFFDKNFSWLSDSHVYLELIFINDNNEFRLIKDFEKKQAILINLTTQETKTNLASINNIINKLLGIPNRGIYESTAFIRQNDVAKIDTNEDLVSAIYQVFLSGNKNINLQKIISDLESTLKKINIGMDRPSKIPGPLKSINDNIINAKQSLQIINTQWKEANRLKQSKKEFGDKLVEIEEKISAYERLIANTEKYNDAIEKLAKIDNDSRIITKKIVDIQTLEQKIIDLDKQLNKYSYFIDQDIEKISREFTRIIEQADHINEELIDINNKVKEDEEQAKQITLKKQKTLILPILGNILIALVGIGISVYFSQLLIALITIVVCIIVFIAFSFYKGEVIEQVKFESGLLFMKNEYEQKLIEINSKIKQQFKLFDIENKEEFYNKKDNYQKILLEIQEHKAHIKGILGHLSFDDLQKQNINLIKAKNEIEINHLNKEIKNSKLLADEYIQKKSELEILYKDRKTYEEQLISSKTKFFDIKIDQEAIIKAEEDLENLYLQQELLHKKITIINMTIQSLQEATNDTYNQVKDIVNSKIEKYLSVITAGKYKNARINDDLSISIFSDAKNDWVDPIGILSVGTVDQIYFLLRLVFVEILFNNNNNNNNNNIPLVLDDPFVSFDHVRKTATKKILEEYIEQNQVLLFTHNREYKGWGVAQDIS
jgi:DNA repair exonuclease SbcCD ATPase subunit